MSLVKFAGRVAGCSFVLLKDFRRVEDDADDHQAYEDADDTKPCVLPPHPIPQGGLVPIWSEPEARQFIDNIESRWIARCGTVAVAFAEARRGETEQKR